MRGAVDIDRRRIAAVALMLVVAAGASGCHDAAKLQRRLDGPPARLPVEPDQAKSAPAPALLDTVRPWKQPGEYGERVTNRWQLVSLRVDDEVELTYRVPQSWTVEDGSSESQNLRRQVRSQASITTVDETELSLASYAAQLAEGNPIFQYPTADGDVVYLTRREVALAPSQPDAPVEVFHTAVVTVDGHVLKLDVRYGLADDWRFDELAAAITGTLQVRRHTDQS